MWYQLQIEHCPADVAELLSEELSESGALSVTFTDKNDDPVLEPAPGTTPLWPEVIIHALFDDELLAIATAEIFKNKNPEFGYKINELADQDWERVWMDDFKPQRFGENLWVCPSWCEPIEPDAVNLILDPGLAFGTGTHPTTSLCLQWLGNADLNEKSVIDYGCGSGILALAAAKLHASHVFAVDIDSQALDATQNNAEKNSISSDQIFIGFPDALNEPADILIANILLSPLLELQSRFRSLLKPGGRIIVSGILASQIEIVKAAYQNDFAHVQTSIENDWALIEFHFTTVRAAKAK